MKVLQTFGLSQTPTQNNATFNSPTQQQTIINAPNPSFPRLVFLSNSGVKVARGTTVCGIQIADLMSAMITLEPGLAYPPLITVQPANTTIQYNSNGTFSITAQSEVSLTYQWQLSTNSGTTWTNVANAGIYSGATTNTLTLTGVTTQGGTFYRCVATNSSGSTNSAYVVLTVQDPGITAQPPNRSGTDPFSTTFTITATGATALSYQWQLSTDGGSTWNNLTNTGIYTGATTATLTLTAATVADTLKKYRCIVTDTNGSQTSSAGTLTVAP